MKELNKTEKMNLIFDTVYIGGGTPSILGDDIKKIMNEIYKKLNTKLNETSIEINPEHVNDRLINIIKDSRINRISLGIQSLNSGLLKLLGRGHSPKNIFRAAEKLYSQDFTINYDFIIGIPGETGEDIENLISFIKKYQPDSISLYFLENITGKYWKFYNLPDDDKKIKYFKIIKNKLESMNFFRIEISNFARSGKEPLHNLKYWNYENFIGLGPSSSSLLGNLRWKNKNSLFGWSESVNRGENSFREKIELSDIEMAKEAIMMGLRKIKGINRIKFFKRFNIDPGHLLTNVLRKNLDCFSISKNTIKIKENYLFLYNSIMNELF